MHHSVASHVRRSFSLLSTSTLSIAPVLSVCFPPVFVYCCSVSFVLCLYSAVGSHPRTTPTKCSLLLFSASYGFALFGWHSFVLITFFLLLGSFSFLLWCSEEAVSTHAHDLSMNNDLSVPLFCSLLCAFVTFAHSLSLVLSLLPTTSLPFLSIRLFCLQRASTHP